MKWLKNKGFDDMGYDKCFGMGEIVILVDFVGDLGFLMIKFWSWCIDESAIRLAPFPVHAFSF